MKFASIGTTWITEAFIGAATLVDGLDYYAAYSRSMEKGRAFADKNGAEAVFDSLDKLALCKEVDAVYIASPNYLHYSQSKLMLEHGKHVICEKPATVTPQEAQELIALSRKNGLVYIEAIMFFNAPAHRAVAEAMPKLGKLSAAHLNYSQFSGKYGELKSGGLPNIFNPELSTGCLMDIGVYNVYTAVALFGYPKRITSAAKFLETGADACGTAVFEYDDLIVTLTYSKVAQSHAASQIYGDKGTMLIDSLSLFNGIRIIYNPDADANKKPEELVYGEDSRQKIMSCEAKRLYDYVAAPTEYRDEYHKSQQLALDVSRAMWEIRRQNPEFRF